jgi:diguanylate cyclase
MLSTLPPDVLPGALAFALSAALLWVSSSNDTPVRTAGADVSALQGVNALLIGLALWWPAYLGHAAATPDALGMPLLLVMAAMGFACGWVSQHGAREPLMATGHLGGAVGTLALAVVLLSTALALPGVGYSWGVAAAPLLFAAPLALGLRLLHLPWRQPRHSNVAKAGGALLAAASMVAMTHRTPGLQAPELVEPVTVPMLVVLGIGIWAARALRHLRGTQMAAPTAGADPLTDPLTGLQSRTAMEQALAALVNQRRQSLKPFALMLVNLDGFKPLNATYGHAVGDEVIKHIGRRLKDLAGSQAVVSRISGDEYVLLVLDKVSPDNALKIAQRLVDRVAQPIKLTTREVSLTCCVGVALFPEHGDADRLLARADTALREAKRIGAGRASLFTPALEDQGSDDFELLADLRRALDHNELQLYYQPKIDAASGQVTAVEALLRWKHPQRGNIAPLVFVTMAERFGLVAKLGDWVIENACRQSRLWSDRGLNMRVAINISAQHMHQPDLGSRIASALSRYRLDPTRLTCEITESVAMENTQATQQTFAHLGQIGVHLSIDDFGTGYSSLAYLRKLPASEVKIDRSFVLDLERSPDARAVIDAVVKLAHALGKRVVAEGVENIRQRRVLTELGCDELQGYLFAHPMPAEDLLQWALEDRRRDEQAFRNSLYMQPSATLQEEIEGLRKPPLIH